MVQHRALVRMLAMSPACSIHYNNLMQAIFCAKNYFLQTQAVLQRPMFTRLTLQPFIWKQDDHFKTITHDFKAKRLKIGLKKFEGSITKNVFVAITTVLFMSAFVAFASVFSFDGFRCLSPFVSRRVGSASVVCQPTRRSIFNEVAILFWKNLLFPNEGTLGVNEK